MRIKYDVKQIDFFDGFAQTHRDERRRSGNCVFFWNNVHELGHSRHRSLSDFKVT